MRIVASGSPGRRVGMLLVIALGLAAVGCGGLPPAPAVPSGMQFEDAEVEPQAGMEDTAPMPLMLFPGDVVAVTLVSAETTTLEGMVVDATGRIHLPLAGEVEVAGVPLGDAEAALEEAMQEFDRFVRVNLRVTEPAGHRAMVLGAVAEPGEVPIPPGARVADLIAAAGGPLVQVTPEGEYIELANLEGARVYRDGRPLPINIRFALQGDPRHNVRAQPGDHVHVPPRTLNRVAVLGAVEGASAFSYSRGMRLTEALALAGGVTIDGDLGDVRIIRGDFRDPQVYVASLSDIVDGDSHDVMLQAGDIVFVTDHWIADFGEVLDRLAPILAAGVSIGVTAAVIESR